MKELTIALLPGDGIGKEIVSSCLKVLNRVQDKVGNFYINFDEVHAGAEYYQRSGREIDESDIMRCGEADAMLLGAMGLPDINFPDGTEIAPHLKLRDKFGLFAGVRPVKSYPNTPQPLVDSRARLIDFVILRESTEGLFASRGKGKVTNDTAAEDTLVITRDTCEKLFDFAFRLARKRKKNGGRGEVTCVDKSNVFRSYAFFRKVFKERANLNKDIKSTFNYVDAQALYLIQRPWDFDVLVMENLLADILSDLGGGLVGGMGMAPCGEIGLSHGLFQPAHGSAPDIAGTDKANPTAMFLSAAMMLDWLSEKLNYNDLETAARLIYAAVHEGFASLKTQPNELGGTHGLSEHTDAILAIIDDL